IGPALAPALTIYLTLARPGALVEAAPILGLWLVSPFWVWWVGRPLPRRAPRLSAEQITFLQWLSRRTWRFFTTFVGPEDHWLPPDNFQEDPRPVVAHRTSPTNVGLYLLSIVAARDFGWIGTLDAVDRLEATLRTIQRLERFRGHFFNWYDTTDLRPLDPRYVSSVDSGNLAGHLIALGHACRDIIERP